MQDGSTPRTRSIAGAQAYAEQQGRLEALYRQRVADLVTPRRVIMRLAVRGFGVRLPD